MARTATLTEELKLILVEMQACRDMYTTNGSASQMRQYTIGFLRKCVRLLNLSSSQIKRELASNHSDIHMV